MANFNIFKKIATAIIMVGALILSCTPLEQPHEINKFNGNQAVGAMIAQPGDTLIGYTYRDLRERFVDDGVEYSYIHVDVYKKAGEVPRSERTAFVVGLDHVGVDAQYFHLSDTLFTTVFGDEKPLDAVTSENGSWKVVKNAKKQIFKAENASKDAFEHATTTGAAAVVYTLPDSDIKGYTVEFPAPSWSLKQNILPIEDVKGVFYDGKSWDAFKYEDEITATFEIAKAYRMDGEESTKEVKVSNLAFFLKHVVDSRLEKIAYVGQFTAEGANLDTKVEEVSGSLVTRDNGDIVKSEDFSLAMRLYLSLIQPEDVRVDSEDELKDESFTVESGEVTETPSASGVYTGKQLSATDNIKLSDRTVASNYGWMSWSWGSTVLPYAEITSRKASVKAVKNETLSTKDILVYTVTVSETVKVSFVGVDRAAEEYVVSVSYNRYYQMPDDYNTEYEQAEYVLELKNDGDSKVFASDQHNTIRTVVKNRGTAVSTSEAKYPLDLYASVAGGDTVKVDKPYKPTVLSIEDHPNTGDWMQKADAQGFDKRWVKDSQTIRIKGGNVIEYVWYYEVQGRNSKDVYDHAEVSGVGSSDVSFSEPVLVDSVRTESTIKKVYRVDAKFTPTVSSTQAQTKSSSNVNSLSVTTSIYQMVVEGDKYIDGEDETEFWAEINPDGGIDVCGRLYERYTLSGKVLVDERRENMLPSLEGVNGEDVVVESAEGYVLTGDGLNKTGKGSYTNYATKNGNKVAYGFNYDAPTSKTINLNGRSGKGASKTFAAAFKIEDLNLTSGSSYTDGDYTVYPKTSNVKGTYSVEDKSVTLNASATRNFKVVIPKDEFVSDRIVKTISQNGNTFNWNVKLYETFSISGEKLKDEKSGSLTPSLSGSNGGEIVVANTNFTTSGNGLNGTGNGTYTDNASNGTNSFSNSYSYNAPASVNVQLNGSNGVKNATISTSWVLTENGQNIGSASTSNGYYVYPYTNKVKGVYTVEDKSATLTAEATKTLKTQIPDDFVSDRVVKTVTKDGNTFNWNVKLYETFSLSGEKLKDEKSGSLTPSLSGSNGGEIVVANVDFKTTGNGANTTGKASYTDNASNGTDSFSNSYSYDAPASVSVQLSGTKGMKTETISTSWTLVENGQNIGSGSASNGYNVYPYTNKVKGTYTVESESVTLTADATKTLKVAIPQDVFQSDRIVKTVTKNGNTFNWNVKLYETFSLSGEKLKDEKSGSLTPSLSGSNGGEIVVANTNFKTSGNGVKVTGNGTYTDTASNDTDSFSNSYSYDAPASVSVQLSGTNGVKTETIATSWTLVENGQNIGTASASNGYNVYPYTNSVKGTYTVESESVTLTADATKTLKVEIPDEFVSDRIVKTVTKNGNTFTWNVKLYETFSISGESLKDEKSGTLKPSLSGSDGGEIVVANTNFTTSGNGASTTGKASYTDNASNGTDSFSNSYSYDAPASVSVQLSGTNGVKNETISTSWTLVENGQNIGSSSASGDYYTYPYTNSVKGTYTVENETATLTANATKTLKVKRSVPKIIPDEWGKIVSAGLSAVPSHEVNGGYADGDGIQNATSCLTIVTDKGAIPVLFGWADQAPRVPTTAQILASTFTAGNFSNAYNSAIYKSNAWAPAIATDEGSGIKYTPASGNVRFVRNETLVMWGWRGGNYSTVLSGYTCSVVNGVLTVTYNGEIVLEIQ